MAALVLSYYMLYELLFFFNYDFLGRFVTAAMVLWKAAFPVGLFAYALSKRAAQGRRPMYFDVYAAFFLVLLGLIAVATLLSPERSSGMYEWFKLVPRFLFLFAIGILFDVRPRFFLVIAKLVAGWSALCVLQYVVLVVSGGARYTTHLPGMDLTFAGPFGILGNITSMLDWPGLPIAIPRLCAYWNEPSNATASIFASGFLARLLFECGEGKLWRLISWACLMAGAATFSNAGYLAIAAAFGFGALFGPGKSAARKLMILPVVLAIAVVALFGRSFVATYMPHNETAKVIVGVRENLDNKNLDEYDPTTGRLDLVHFAIANVTQHPLGLGMYSVAEDETKTRSASAPILWFTTAGIGGLVVLLVREAAAAVAAITESRRSYWAMYIAQAWIVVVFQNLSYGDWMGPWYIILVAAVLTDVGGRLTAEARRLSRPGVPAPVAIGTHAPRQGMMAFPRRDGSPALE